MKLPIAALLATLCGCAEDYTEPAVEVLVRQSAVFAIAADGVVKSTSATPLLVPGQQWTQRTLLWSVPDGSRVEADQVVARFSAAQSELALSKALLDLKRNLLSRYGKQDELDAVQGRVAVDLAQVGTDLAIAERYADAEFEMFARNQILDAVQDRRFLTTKQGVLVWRRDQSAERGAVELAVVDAQKTSYQLNAERRRKDLAALELRAPNAGVLMLSANWSGEKARVGSSLMAGEEFANLPDVSNLEVEFFLPQSEAQGLAADLKMDLHPVGRPDQAIGSTMTWVASAPQRRDRENPVKFINFKAPLPADAVRGFGWVPGQAFRGKVYLFRSDAAISVPNVAVVADGPNRFVDLKTTNGIERRAIELGVRGAARSEVLKGVQEGDAVLLTPQTKKSALESSTAGS